MVFLPIASQHRKDGRETTQRIVKEGYSPSDLEGKSALEWIRIDEAFCRQLPSSTYNLNHHRFEVLTIEGDKRQLLLEDRFVEELQQTEVQRCLKAFGFK